jgi:hypothetical protein
MMDSFNDFLRVTLRPQQLFSRLTTVLVSSKDGIYALVGKLRQGTKETVTCELMFDAEKGWTQEKAETWVKDHKNSTERDTPKPSPKPEPLDPFEVLAKSRRVINSR